jgi:hypothetical protein
MPSIHISEPAFDTLAEEYGYSGAKRKVKVLVNNHAEEIQDTEAQADE